MILVYVIHLQSYSLSSLYQPTFIFSQVYLLCAGIESVQTGQLSPEQVSCFWCWCRWKLTTTGSLSLSLARSTPPPSTLALLLSLRHHRRQVECTLAPFSLPLPSSSASADLMRSLKGRAEGGHPRADLGPRRLRRTFLSELRSSLRLDASYLSVCVCLCVCVCVFV